MKIPAGENATIAVGDREVQLTNLDKPFWPELGLTKRDLLQYYADVASVLLPHLVRPGDGDEALSRRRRRRAVLHEARADAAAGMDRDLRDHARRRAA